MPSSDQCTKGSWGVYTQDETGVRQRAHARVLIGLLRRVLAAVSSLTTSIVVSLLAVLLRLLLMRGQYSTYTVERVFQV